MNPIKKKYEFNYQWSDKQFFIYACLTWDLQKFYRDWIEQGGKTGREQFFITNSLGELEHLYWRPSPICSVSGERLTKENIDVLPGYWTPNLWKPVRKDILAEAKRQEVIWCQNLDCSCSDCYFMHRAKIWCTKFNKKAKVEPNTANPENMNCFQHRKEVIEFPYKNGMPNPKYIQ